MFKETSRWERVHQTPSTYLTPLTPHQRPLNLLLQKLALRRQHRQQLRANRLGLVRVVLVRRAHAIHIVLDSVEDGIHLLDERADVEVEARLKLAAHKQQRADSRQKF